MRFATISKYHLTDWWCDVSFCFFTSWFDSNFFVIAIWDGEPVNLNSHRLNRLTKCANYPPTKMIWLIYACHATEVPKRTFMMCFMQQGIKFTEIWHTVFCLYSGSISHTNTQTHKDIEPTQGPVDWRIHINMYLHHLLCSHNSYLISIIHWYQKWTFHKVFSFQTLFTCKWMNGWMNEFTFYFLTHLHLYPWNTHIH